MRTVAIHALMAGCKPEYLPVVLGGLALMLREEFNLNGVQGTMHGVAPLMIVNGPYAQKIGVHGGNGCFGPGFRANASIGRAIRLMLLNLGGGIPGCRFGDCFLNATALYRVLDGKHESAARGTRCDIARLFARRQRDHVRDGREPAPLLRRREPGTRAPPDRHRRLDGRDELVEHACALRHGRGDGPEQATICASAD